MIYLTSNLQGSILDIGGGGDGIIGRLYGDRVVAIDNVQEELDEAPGGFGKVLMDATNLQFADQCFDNVTFFYSLMYMTLEEQRASLREAARVLKNGGTLSVWDCEISSAYPNPFLAELDISLMGQPLHTTYGIVKMDTQSCASISALCMDAGFCSVECTENNGHFYSYWKKP